MRTRLHHQLGLVISVLWACTAQAAPPLPLDKVASADDLVAEATAKGAEIEALLASPEAFQENPNKLRLSASLLAVIGQALAEHPQDSKLKAAGPSLREAALVLARGKSFDDAKAAWPAVQAALAGTAAGQPPVEFDWAKLTRMRPAMEEMEQRATQLRRVLRRSRDPATDSRHAMAIALLAVTTHADLHEVKDPAGKPQWQAWATALQQHMSASAKAIQSKDMATANKEFLAGMETCTQCHDAFKKP